MQKSHDTATLNKIDILDVAKALGLSVKNKKTLCFLHTEKTPSLSFDIRTNKWYCFGCHAGGDVIKLVMQKEQLGFQEACEWLEQQFFVANTYLQSYYPRKWHKIGSIKKPVSKVRIEPDYALYTAIVKDLVLSEKAKIYLFNARALSPDVVRSHYIVSLEDTKLFYAWLNKSFNFQRLLKAGLYKINDMGEVYPLWRKPGIVFPFFDISNRIINLQIRPYESTKGQKYIFLSGAKTCMYNESCLTHLPLGSNIFLCEGAIDTLSMLTLGYEAVGLPGAGTLKDEWVDILTRFNINIVLDNDETGHKNAVAHEKILKARNVNVQQYSIELYGDINEMLVAERGKTSE